VAIRNAVGLLGANADLPESFWYSVKRRVLGPPMVNAQLTHQRLSNWLALGVLSPDGISSSAYGTEEILIALLPLAGLTAFTLILPMTLVILVVMALVVLSYREVVMAYIRPGGSYVVARENFGPRVAQVAAVALLIDYVVTVAVQTSAGTAAVVSAFPALGPFNLEITIGVVLLMCYGNLRGIREAGRAFAIPTYLFSGAVILMIVVGVVRDLFGDLPHYVPPAGHHTYTVGAGTTGLITFAMIFTLLRAFANGGASLTGIEAVSDAVGAFRPPEGINARRVLVTEGCILGFLVAGISWLAFATHPLPFKSGYPTVLAQETGLVFGHTWFGQALFVLVQAATALILYTGGNTSFNGFPFLASYVAGDAFLPRWLLKRGHRLVFSNAIIGLTIVSVALLIVRGANVNNLVPLYAIGVFTAFAMTGFGMARYHLRNRAPGWRHRLVTNASAGALTAVVVAIFAVVKFTEGAWIVVVAFPVLVFALIRLNHEYSMEAEVLERVGTRPKPPEAPNYPRRTVFVLADSFDLATLAALRYARSLRPTSLRAVHFVIDTDQAESLREEWDRADRGVVLNLIDCPDRRLARAASELVSAEAAQPGTHVTVVLPRRSYSPFLGRFLHDRTADRIAAVVSRIPQSVATIVPFDVRSRLDVLHARQVAAPDGQQAKDGAAALTTPSVPSPRGKQPAAKDSGQDAAGLRGLLRRGKGQPGSAAPPPAEAKPSYGRPAPSAGATPIGSLTAPGRATVEGRVRTVEIRPVERNSVLACEVSDSTGDLTALFYGRSHIPGIICGSKVRFRGPVGIRPDGPVMINPAYELLAAGGDPATGGEESP
jgi:amino acid transporter